MAKKKTSLVIEEDLWKEMKKHCIDLGKDMSEVIEDLIRKEVGKKK